LPDGGDKVGGFDFDFDRASLDDFVLLGSATGLFEDCGKGIWLVKMSDDGTNIQSSQSVDGQNWQPFGAARSRTADFTSGPTQVWWGTYHNGSASAASLLSWQRRELVCHESDIAVLALLALWVIAWCVFDIAASMWRQSAPANGTIKEAFSSAKRQLNWPQ